MELTPVAVKEGVYLVDGLFKNEWRQIDYNKVPTTVFTPIEFSTCGLAEEKAIDQFGEENIETYHASFKPLEWNLSYEKPNAICYWKIVC